MNETADHEKRTHSMKLGERYETEIRMWDWTKIRKDAYENPQWDECGEVVFSSYLGENLHPSGKTYAPWTTNQTV